jgi:hypothetical protein
LELNTAAATEWANDAPGDQFWTPLKVAGPLLLKAPDALSVPAT